MEETTARPVDAKYLVAVSPDALTAWLTVTPPGPLADLWHHWRFRENRKSAMVIRSLAVLSLCLSLFLAGCSSVNLWPFGDDKPAQRNLTPANATAYQCSGGKRLYVRYLDKAAWVILPEREFRLEKDEGGRYRNGATVLETEEGGVALREGTSVMYAACKTAAAGQN